MRFRLPALRRPTGRIAALPLVTFVVLTTFACSLDKLTQPQGTANKPTFTVAGDTTVALGGTTPMSLTSSAGGTLNASSAAILWASQSPDIATVDPVTGVVTGV